MCLVRSKIYLQLREFHVRLFNRFLQVEILIFVKSALSVLFDLGESVHGDLQCPDTLLEIRWFVSHCCAVAEGDLCVAQSNLNFLLRDT